MGAVLVKNAERMMTSAEILKDGIEFAFADGRGGMVPFAKISKVESGEFLARVELPNPYEAVLHTKSGETIELPWDFVRHYCDSSYRPRVEAVALSGRQAIGVRIRQLRESAGLTQQALAQAANIARVTLVRIENAGQAPRYETLVSLAQALGRPMGDLVAVGQDARAKVAAAPGAQKTDESDFKPIQISGEDLSDTVQRERR